jgi:hypothetical protein
MLDQAVHKAVHTSRREPGFGDAMAQALTHESETFRCQPTLDPSAAALMNCMRRVQGATHRCRGRTLTCDTRPCGRSYSYAFFSSGLPADKVAGAT